MKDFRTNTVFQSENKLIITGLDICDVPFQVFMNTVSNVDDLRSTQEEADVIIIHQLLHAIKNFESPITVICDDTDVFLLLLHFYKIKGLKNNVYIEETSKERKVISINGT